MHEKLLDVTKQLNFRRWAEGCWSWESGLEDDIGRIIPRSQRGTGTRKCLLQDI